MEKPWTDKLDSITLKGGNRTLVQKGYSYDYKWEYIDRNNPKIVPVIQAIKDSLTLYAGYAAGVSVNAINANGSYDFPDTKYNYKISRFSKLFNENAHPLINAVVMQADEVQFLLAEAAVKGWASGDAETY